MSLGCFMVHIQTVGHEWILTPLSQQWLPRVPNPGLQYTSFLLDLDLTKRRERPGHVQECPKHHERWFRQWLGGNVKKTCSAKSFPVRLKIQTLLFLNNNYGNETVVTSVMRQFRECGRFVSWAISRPGKRARNHTWHTSGTLALQIFDSLNPNIRALLL